MASEKKYFKPGTVEELFSLFEEFKEDYLLLAGGTSAIFQRNSSHKALIDLAGIGLSYIKREGEFLRVGAMSTITDILEDKNVETLYNGVLKKLCYNFSSTQIRNCVTVGGNICQIYPWSELPVILAGIPAKIVISSKKGEEEINSEDFFSAHPLKSLKKKIVKEIKLPLNLKNCFYSYKKYSKTSNDYPGLMVFVKVELDNERIIDANIICGALNILPQKLKSSKEFYQNKTITELPEVPFTLGENEVKINPDMRFGKDFRFNLLENYINYSMQNIKALCNGEKI